MKEREMNTKAEGTFAIIAALIVLFSAMWNPLVSVAVSAVALAAFGANSLYKKISKIYFGISNVIWALF